MDIGEPYMQAKASSANPLQDFLNRAREAEPQQHSELLSEAVDIIAQQLAPVPSQIPPNKKEIEKVCRGIGHDFNGILANIRGMVEITQMMVPDAPENVQNTFVKILSMVERGHHASEMIRLYGKVYDCQKKQLQLAPFLKRCLNDIRIRLEMPFFLEVPSPDDTHLLMDEMQLEALLLQLIKNAQDAVTQVNEQSIQVALSVTTDGQLQISVHDQGCGIDPDVGEELFQPFYSTKKAGTGIGLGLSIVKQIVMNHDGSIAYTSSKTEGTHFTCILPVIVT
ncbi:sensor histidine kinase [Planctobacterium marinum]|uniref:histidine kinase n=1 Tax=Planctobacterium marinum TaxID=1631968 RepID=A0AA48HUW4_9ALTE|nr:hypothetical protein MACH26_39350 [Planctobacterium marinum]